MQVMSVLHANKVSALEPLSFGRWKKSLPLLLSSPSGLKVHV